MSVVNSKVDICNLALIYCGATLITSLTDDTMEAKICNVLYPVTRDTLLRNGNWNFAAKTSELTLSTETIKGFAYVYQLPDDLLKVVKLVRTEYSFRIYGNKLASDGAGLSLEYIARIKDVSLYDSSFVEALAQVMASKMIFKFNQSINAKESIKQDAKEALRDARTNDGQEGTMFPVVQDTWSDSRYVGVSDEDGF
jgi:hypothetical protein